MGPPEGLKSPWEDLWDLSLSLPTVFRSILSLDLQPLDQHSVPALWPPYQCPGVSKFPWESHLELDWTLFPSHTSRRATLPVLVG